MATNYRYDEEKILNLIETALTNGWPVTFDNVYHAMTIIGFEKTANGTYYAVADSAPASIKWYPAGTVRYNLNLVTVAKTAIEGLIPPRDESNVCAGSEATSWTNTTESLRKEPTKTYRISHSPRPRLTRPVGIGGRTLARRSWSISIILIHTVSAPFFS